MSIEVRMLCRSCGHDAGYHKDWSAQVCDATVCEQCAAIKQANPWDNFPAGTTEQVGGLTITYTKGTTDGLVVDGG